MYFNFCLYWLITITFHANKLLLLLPLLLLLLILLLYCSTTHWRRSVRDSLCKPDKSSLSITNVFTMQCIIPQWRCVHLLQTLFTALSLCLAASEFQSADDDITPSESTAECRDRFGPLPVARFALRSCALCYVYLGNATHSRRLLPVPGQYEALVRVDANYTVIQVRWWCDCTARCVCPLEIAPLIALLHYDENIYYTKRTSVPSSRHVAAHHHHHHLLY